MSEEPGYDEFVKVDPNISKVVTRDVYDYLLKTNETTEEFLLETWRNNIRDNIKKRYGKHGALVHDFGGFGFNKAIIAVGAGPSFNRNCHILKKLYEANMTFTLKEQPFIIMASNHQYKPLLEMGIFPHFVVLVDASDAVYDQLNTDIPELGKDSILVCSLQANPKVLKEWECQGRHICFYLPNHSMFNELFKKLTKDDPKPINISQGGNVINTMWQVALRHLRSTVFMCVGNDLSFPFSPEYEVRKAGFYADGDYQVNIDNDRDEAKDRFAWMGFEFMSSLIHSNLRSFDWKLVGTSRLLWIYKSWVEMHVAAYSNQFPNHYYNCSEQGILGVLAHEHDPEAMKEKENWYLMDELYPLRWHTRTLADAARQFLEARECLLKEETLIVAPYAGALLGKTGIARGTTLH